MATNLETKIGRIRNNVTAALAKIAEKGVTVPEGAGSDDLEGLIDAIKGIKILDVGSVTPTADTIASNYGIAHGLGATPDFFILIASGHFTNGEYQHYVKYSSSFKCSYEAGVQSYKVHRVYGYGDTNGLTSSNGTAFNISDAFDSNKFYLKLPPYVKLKAGITYCWAVGVIDTLE